MTNRYLSAKEVAGLLDIAESTAYAVIRKWNKELKEQGYFTKAGSVRLRKARYPERDTPKIFSILEIETRRPVIFAVSVLAETSV